VHQAQQGLLEKEEEGLENDIGIDDPQDQENYNLLAA
jgi:hypothetical protein